MSAGTPDSRPPGRRGKPVTAARRAESAGDAGGRGVRELTVVEICAGAGGQALGLEQAGFAHAAAVEIDADACETLRRNRGDDWKIIEDDVANLDGHAFAGTTCSQVACPARRSRSRASSSAATTSATCSRRRSGWWPRSARARCCWRTFGAGNGEVCRLSRPRPRAAHGPRIPAWWQLINASEHGVPQLRPRFVLVAIAEPWAAAFAWPLPVPQPPPTVGETLADLMGSAAWPGAADWAARADRHRTDDRRRQQEARRPRPRTDQGAGRVARARRRRPRYRRRPAAARLASRPAAETHRADGGEAAGLP